MSPRITIQKHHSSFGAAATARRPETRHARRLTLLAFLAALLVSGIFIAVVENSRLQSRQKTATAATTQVAYGIHDQLNHSLSATFALAAVIRQNKGKIEHFPQLADEMLNIYDGINNLQLAPNGIITQIVPLSGNEKAIGHNLLEDTKRNKEALLALRSKQLTLAGPFELIQGGVAVIGRKPVFLQAPGGGEYFWGFANALIKIPDLLKTAGIQQLTSSGYRYELSRIHPDTGQRDLFASSGEALHAPVSKVIQVPNGSWTLAVEPVQGWFSTVAILLEVGLGLLFSTIIAVMVHWLASQPAKLQRMVDKRTAELSTANQQLETAMTERKRAEHCLLESEARYRELVENSAAWLWETDANLHHTYSNQYVETMLGYSVDELLKTSMFNLLHPDDHQQVKQFIIAAKQGRPGWKDAILRCRHANGSWRHIQTCGKAIFDPAGKLIGLSGVNLDVTDHIRLQEEQEKGQRLESLGVLAGGIAHDFNNILTGIIGNISLASMLIEPGHKAQERLQQSERACQRAVALTRQLLTFAKGGDPIKTITDIFRIVSDASQLSLHGSDSTCDLEKPQGLWVVEADEGQLTQVFNNLIINAVQAMPNGGTVKIRLTNCQIVDEPAAPAPPGKYVRIAITDQGEGISPENLEKIFDPYFTTKSYGTGLGLTSAHSIVKKHGGHLTVSSEIGKGTRFEVYLPAISGGEAPAEPTAEQPPIRGKGRVLVMDDEESLRNVLAEMLVMLGYEVACCSGGEEAIEMYQAAHAGEKRFAAVILDLTISGGMGGKDAARQIRGLDPRAILIATSGYSSDPVMAAYGSFGFDGAVAKPFRVNELAAMLSRVIIPDFR